MNKKKIIILGATGFLGSHLCKSLIENAISYPDFDDFLSEFHEHVQTVKSR